MTTTYTIKIDKMSALGKCRVCTRVIYPSDIAAKMRIENDFQTFNMNCHTACLIRKIILDTRAIRANEVIKEIHIFDKISKLLDMRPKKKPKRKQERLVEGRR